ncbi:MAG: tetratricopeptide repeat protein [Candidatus Euphemobacter frigidus]|nr:tetratricopeptide repeat protein [Candidatus Euphemobacter frigidus]
MKWYRKAAEQGHASAQFALGMMYHKGQGVELDDREAIKWLHKAAEQGQSEAKYILKIIDTEGR